MDVDRLLISTTTPTKTDLLFSSMHITTKAFLKAVTDFNLALKIFFYRSVVNGKQTDPGTSDSGYGEVNISTKTQYGQG